MTGVISNAGGNIESIVNKSKKDWAYTMVDVTGDVDSAKADILAIEGVTGVRIL